MIQVQVIQKGMATVMKSMPVLTRWDELLVACVCQWVDDVCECVCVGMCVCGCVWACACGCGHVHVGVGMCVYHVAVHTPACEALIAEGGGH